MRRMGRGMGRGALGMLIAVLAIVPDRAVGQATGTAPEGSIDNLRHPPGTETAPLGTLGDVVRRGEGPVHLLLLPGAPFGADVWDAFMERNAERYTMWAITQPGYGGTAPSPMPSWDDLSASPWSDGVQEAIVRLIADEGMRRPFVVGHHLESDRRALRLGLEHPELISGVAVMAGVAGQDLATVDSSGRRRAARPEEVIPTLRDQWVPMWRTVTAEGWRQGTYPPSALSVHPVRGQDLFARQVAVPIPTQVRYFVELTAEDLRPLMPRLEVPLLVISAVPVETLGEHFDRASERILQLPEFQGMEETDGRAAYVSSRVERFGSEDAALCAIYGAPWLELPALPPDTEVEAVGPSGVFVFQDRPEVVDRLLAEWIRRKGAS